jgi:hypothetical protein
MFQLCNITDLEREEFNIWADSVINRNIELMSSGKAYLIWSNKLYYQPGKDTWVDESWWIEIAKHLFDRHKNDYEGRGTSVIPALEILVHYFPEDYQDYARDRIDLWYEEQGYHDPEYWLDLIVAVYPDHPVTKLLFEEQENIWESSIAIKLGDRETIIQTKDNILSDLKDGDFYMVIQNLSKFNKISFNDVFSQTESNVLELEMLNIAEKYLLMELRECLDFYDLLKSAIELGWNRIVDSLSTNINYLTKLMYLFEESSSTDFLLWSLTNKYLLTENLAFQLRLKIPSLNRIYHRSFPSHSFAMAIAWKRSQSKASVF